MNRKILVRPTVSIRHNNAYASHEIIYDSGGKAIDYVFLDINQDYAAMVGFSAAQIVGRKASEILPMINENMDDWLAIVTEISETDAPKHWNQHFGFDKTACRFEAFSTKGGNFVTICHATQEAAFYNEAHSRYFHYSRNLLLIASQEGILNSVNPAWQRVLGWSSEELVGTRLIDIVYPIDRKATGEIIQRLKSGRVVTGFENRCLTKNGSFRWLLWQAWADKDSQQYYGVAVDIHERKVLENRLDQLNRLYAVYSSVNREIVRARDASTLMHKICEVTVRYGRFVMAWIGGLNHETGMVEPLAGYGRHEGYVQNVNISFKQEPYCSGPTGLAIKTGRCDVCSDVEKEERMKPWREAARQKGYRSSAAVPIFDGDSPAYVLNVYAEGTGVFQEDERRLLDELGADIGYALTALKMADEKRRYEEELRISGERYRLIFEQSPAGLFVYNNDLKIQESNQRFHKILQLGSETAAGASIRDTVYPNILPPIESALTGRYTYYEGPSGLAGRDGLPWISLQTAPVYEASGVIVGGIGIIEDISDRIKNQELMERSRDFYLDWLNRFPALIWKTDENGQCDYFNHAWLDYTGRSLAEEEGSGWTEGLHPEQRDVFLQTYEEAFQARQPFEMEFQLRRHDGEYRWMIIVGRPFEGMDKSFSGYTGFCLDIHERRVAESALRRSEQRFRDMFKKHQAVMLLVDPEDEGRIIDCNAAAVKFYGYSAEELNNMNIGEIDHLNDGERIALWRQAQKGKTRFHFKHHLQDGQIRDVEVFTARIEEEGRALLFSIVHDITDRRIAEEALQQQSDFLQRLIDSIPNPVFYKDCHGLYRGCNTAFESFVGVSKAEIIGKTVWDIAPDDLASYYNEIDNLLVDKPGVMVYESEAPFNDGSRRPALFYKAAYYNANGEIAGLVGVLLDITEIKQAEAEIKRLNMELEQRVTERTADLVKLNEELESFSYSVSHDLRGPLRAIGGYANIIMEDYADQVSPEVIRMLSLIYQNIRRMGNLIDDLLTFSRLGRQEKRNRHFDMQKLCKDVYGDLMVEMSDEDRDRDIEFLVPVLPVAYGDYNLIRQMVHNLLANSLKFTRYRSRAVIEVGSVPSLDPGQHVYFIRDNGAGFDAKYSDKLFKVFQRLHRETEFEGTGVGLAISRRIVERHGGAIWAEGVVDQGATFYFSLSIPKNNQGLSV